MAEGGMKPRILLIPCPSSTPLEDLLTGITNCDYKDLVNDSSEYEHFTEFAWTIDNKYYSAEVTLLLVKNQKPTLSIREVIDELEGVVIFIQLGDTMSFAMAQEWGRLFELTDIELKVLLSKEVVESKEIETARGEVDSWCVNNSFEFVESVQNDDGDFSENIGFDRVKEILDTHLWPNMKRKSKELWEWRENDQTEDENLPTLTDTQSDGQILNGDEAQLEGFETLFGQMHEMKLHAQSLPDDQRKEYAEEVTLAFWKAMGFDEDEIAGL